jgi:hypothetical protein
MILKTNMCLLRAVNESDANKQKEFTKWLLKVGKGHIPNINGLGSNIIQLPNDIILQLQNINDLINFIYPNLSIYPSSKYLVERAIFIPKN